MKRMFVSARWLWEKNSNDEHGRSESRSMNTTMTKLSWRIISRWTRLSTISWREYPMYDYAIKRGCVSKMPPILKGVREYHAEEQREEWMEFHSPKAEGEKMAASEHVETNLAPRRIKCFNCKESGHRATECAKPRIAASKSTDTRPDESASKAISEMNLIQRL